MTQAEFKKEIIKIIDDNAEVIQNCPFCYAPCVAIKGGNLICNTSELVDKIYEKI